MTARVAIRFPPDVAEILERIEGKVDAIDLALDGLRRDHALISAAVGTESPDGNGGTGVIGRMIRLEHHAKSLDLLKEKGRGVFFGALIVAAIAWLGLKGAVKAAFGSMMATFGL